MSFSADSRPLRVYRIPVYAKGDSDKTPYVRSPSADSNMIVARRRASTPPLSNVRIVEVQSPSGPTYVKRYYPSKRRTRLIREPSPLSPSTDASSSLVSPHPVPLIQQPRLVRLPTTSTTTSSSTGRVLPIANRTRRAFVETPVAIVSETPLVTRGTSPRKQWKKKDTKVPLDLDRDVYVSDEDYYEEAFPDGVSQFKPETYLRTHVFFADLQAKILQILQVLPWKLCTPMSSM